MNTTTETLDDILGEAARARDLLAPAPAADAVAALNAAVEAHQARHALIEKARREANADLNESRAEYERAQERYTRAQKSIAADAAEHATEAARLAQERAKLDATAMRRQRVMEIWRMEEEAARACVADGAEPAVAARRILLWITEGKR